MTLPGETVGLKRFTLCSCGNELPLLVLSSPAGYYLGFYCPECGPYSRETNYVSKEQAQEYLDDLRQAWSGKRK